jgi:hypothetical protein
VSIEKVKIESQQELEQMIAKEIGQIDKDLTMICNNVPINDKATLDMLCHDNNGQLVIVQMNVNEDDIMLLHGIQSLDYIDKFKSFLKATYSKHKIDDKEKPRLILIAPSFSDAVRRAVESMKGIRVDLYEWEYLKLGDHKGLRLQPIFAWNPTEKPTEEPEDKHVEKKHEPKPLKKKEPLAEHEAEMKEKVNPETPKEEPMFPVPPEEEPKEEKDIFKTDKDDSQQKKKLRLF